MTDCTHHYASPLGGITLSSDGGALTGLCFDGQLRFAAPPAASPAEDVAPVFRQAISWLELYFGGRDPGFTPPLRLRATPFRLAVWQILLDIPYGQTSSYGDVAAAVARRMGLPRMSARAIGGAVGHNPVALIIPCHRVIGADGSLTGYAGGVARKRRLLELEQNGAYSGSLATTSS